MNQLSLTLEPPKAHIRARRKPPKVREIRIDGDIAYIPLTKGHVTIVDAADAHLFAGFNWFASEQEHAVYAFRHGPRPRRQCIRVHQVLMPEAGGRHVDHIDGDGLNNRRSNLRFATVAENAHNRKKPANNSSGFKGVHWHKLHCKWIARIMVRGSRKTLGYFDEPQHAYEAYCEASKHLHGEFGRVA